MADINILRSDNGNVDVDTPTDKITFAGAAISLKEKSSSIVIRAIGGDSIELFNTKSLNIGGVNYAAGWNPATIRGVLKQDTFFKAPTGGAATTIAPVVGDTFEHEPGVIQEWSVLDGATLEVTGLDDLDAGQAAIGIVKVIQPAEGGVIPALPGNDDDVVWNINADGVTMLGYVYDGEILRWESTVKNGFSFSPIAKAYFAQVNNLSFDVKMKVNAMAKVIEEIGVDKVKVWLPMRGGTAAMHKWNAIDMRDADDAFRATFGGGGWVHSATGAKADGVASFADTKFNIGTNDDVPELSDLDNPRSFCSLYAAGRNDSAAGVDHAYMGCSRSSFYVVQEAYNTSIDSAGGNAAAATGALPSRNGVISLHRKSSVMCQAFHNKTQMGANLTAEYSLTISLRTNVYLNAQNNAGTARYFSPNECRGYLMTDGNITDAQREKLVDALIAFNADRPIV